MSDKPQFIEMCECGGKVMGVTQFGRIFCWCDRCSPVVVVDAPKKARLTAPKETT